MKEKYINPFTDFGFKSIVGTEPDKDLSPIEREEYEKSLKVYRDLKNSLDTAWEEGLEEGREERREQQRIEIARTMLQNKEDLNKIVKYTGLTVDQIEELRKRLEKDNPAG